MRMVRVEVVDETKAGGSRLWTNPFVVKIPDTIPEALLCEVRTGIKIHLEGWMTLVVEPDNVSAKEGLYVVGWRTDPELYVAVMSSKTIHGMWRKLAVLVTVLEKHVVPVRFVESKDGGRMICGKPEDVTKEEKGNV